MSGAGLFAGEITQAAPEADAPTTKPRSYVWMEYGTPFNTVVPTSGEGWALTQDDWFPGPPIFPNPFINEVWPEITISAVFKPDDMSAGFLFNIMAIGGINFFVTRRPISFEEYFGVEINTTLPSFQLITQGTQELTLDHPTWDFNDWYWMGVSYSQTLNECKFAIVHFLSGTEAVKVLPITSNVDISWGPSLTSQSQIAWGMEGSVNGVDPLGPFAGPMSQVMIHDSYKDFGDEFTRRQFAGLNGIIDLGPTGNFPFGTTPQVYLPRGWPEENLGTRFIGNQSDMYLRNQVSTDLDLPPVAA